MDVAGIRIARIDGDDCFYACNKCKLTALDRPASDYSAIGTSSYNAKVVRIDLRI
jgi:hypothetical protein